MKKQALNFSFVSNLVALFLLAIPCSSFGILKPSTRHVTPIVNSGLTATLRRIELAPLRMSDAGGGGGGAGERKTSKKRGLSTITIDKQKVEEEEDEKDDTEWRVLLHNDEVHTFEYVVDSLVKVIGTIDRKLAWDICVLVHGNGKATIVKAWKDQAEKYCLGLQRQGLTASISPDNNFKAKGMNNDLGGAGEQA